MFHAITNKNPYKLNKFIPLTNCYVNFWRHKWLIFITLLVNSLKIDVFKYFLNRPRVYKYIANVRPFIYCLNGIQSTIWKLKSVISALFNYNFFSKVLQYQYVDPKIKHVLYVD